MLRQRLTIIVFIVGLFLPLSYAAAGTVLSAHKYAWSDQVGYINFENVVISDATLSGYAWSANKGFIKFNPALGGVFNDGTGNLSGSAWGEQLGWISFSGVVIDSSTGKFSGTATGTLAGTITFDCPNYCDVQTNWPATTTPSPAPATTTVTSGGTAIPVNLTPIASNQAVANNQPLTLLPYQPGIVSQDTIVGPVIVNILPGSFSNQTTFTVHIEPLIPTSNYLLPGSTNLVSSVFYDIFAKDQNGNFIYYFLKPITITLPVPKNLSGAKNLGVYWFNETNQQWALIPDALFTDGKVTFQTNNLARFAIFETVSVSQKPAPSIFVPAKTKPTTSTIKVTPAKPKTALQKIGDFFRSIISAVSTFFGSIWKKIIGWIFR